MHRAFGAPPSVRRALDDIMSSWRVVEKERVDHALEMKELQRSSCRFVLFLLIAMQNNEFHSPCKAR